jgi:hypothetical protein
MQNTIAPYLPPAVHYIGFFPHIWVGEVAAFVGAIRLFLARKHVHIKGMIPIFLTLTNSRGDTSICPTDSTEQVLKISQTENKQVLKGDAVIYLIATKTVRTELVEVPVMVYICIWMVFDLNLSWGTS